MKKSIYLTIAATALLFAVLSVLTFTLPSVLRGMSAYLQARDISKLIIPLYISAVPGFLSVICLLKLLFNLNKDKVFVKENVNILSVLSWSCIFVGVEYFILNQGFISMILIAFAALFFGLILAVIKNVFVKAVIIREENDYTV